MTISDMTIKHTLPVQIRFSDVDAFGHMNNSVYFSLYDLAKSSYLKEVAGETDWDKTGVVVANVNADFLAPVFISDQLEIETAVIHLGHKSFTLMQRAIDRKSGLLKCQCRTVMVAYDTAAKKPVELPDPFKQAVCAYEGKTLEELEATHD